VSARPFRVIALLSTFNEEDVIAPVVEHLIRQGVEVMLIDHCSTDATVERVQPFLGSGLIRIERFPDESRFPAEDAHHYAWRNILRRKEQLAATLEADWFLHHDADELRESPWEAVSLRDALQRVDAAGFNAVDFKALDFLPLHDGFRPGDDLRTAFTHYRPAASYDQLRINAWKKQPAVDLASTGGHDARFEGRRVFPYRFLLRHYPIRSNTQGQRKIFAERLPRYDDTERSMGWHVQYQGLTPGASLLLNEGSLTRFDDVTMRETLWQENRDAEEHHRAAVALMAAAEAAEANAAAMTEDLQWFRREWPQRENELVAARLEVAELHTRVAALERQQESNRAEMIGVQDRAVREVKAMQHLLDEMRTSKTWRWSAPLRRLIDRFSHRAP
jgi:hypothetical protein